MESKPQKGRCVNCRSEVNVPESYAHGDHIKCGVCNVQHRVVRGEGLRLVIADTAPLKEALRSNDSLIDRLEAELRTARGSLGIGVNGLGVGLIYVVWQLAMADQEWSRPLLWHAAWIALGSGVLLELANGLFLAKHQRIKRLAAELEAARAEGRQIQQKLRESSRV